MKKTQGFSESCAGLPLFETMAPAVDDDLRLLARLLEPRLGHAKARALARSLLMMFDGLAGVIHAPADRLSRLVEGNLDVIGDIQTSGAIATRLSRGRVLNRPLLSSHSALRDWLQTTMGALQAEEMRVLFLDRKNRLIIDEVMGRGTVDHVPVYPREVLRRALEHQASALILVHNHPSGDPEPSAADVDMTRQIATAGAVLSITLHDHLIIGAGCEVSFRARGLL